MNNRLVVAVDGPAGSGKSSVSREVARNNNLKYIDSGALYRSVTWYFLQQHSDLSPGINFKAELKNIALRQEFNADGTADSYVNDRDVSSEIRNEIITGNIGVISDNLDIREYINSILREWAQVDSIIMDGRDIGTVVFPDADLKIYLDASVEIRTDRRAKEYREMGKNVDENDIKNQIIQRDNQDMDRPFGALKQAEDALKIDTSPMNRQEVIDLIGEYIKKQKC